MFRKIWASSIIRSLNEYIFGAVARGQEDLMNVSYYYYYYYYYYYSSARVELVSPFHPHTPAVQSLRINSVFTGAGYLSVAKPRILEDLGFYAGFLPLGRLPTIAN
jgi:hypothetical protein